MNVREYFITTFPDHTLDDSQHSVYMLMEALTSMPLDSNCGDECKKAIDAASTFVGCIRMAYGDDRPELLHSVYVAVTDVCGCFICG